MAFNLATSLDTALLRIVDRVIDTIAVDGVQALKNVLDDAGFMQLDALKDYEVYAHVSGRVITFEILIPASAFDTSDPETRKAVEQAGRESDEEVRTPGVRTYGFQPTSKAGRLTGRRDARRDARKSVWDARRDARKPPKTLQSKAKTAQSRLIEHEIALHAPRGMVVNREGMVSLKMTKTVEDTPDGGVRLPKGKFQGVIGKFVDELADVVRENFVPELEKLLAERLS